MTTDELLNTLPTMIGNHIEDGRYVIWDRCDEIGYLMLTSKGELWQASYGMDPCVCLNPQDESTDNYAVAWGNTPNEALMGLYDWCKRNGFIQ